MAFGEQAGRYVVRFATIGEQRPRSALMHHRRRKPRASYRRMPPLETPWATRASG